MYTLRREERVEGEERERDVGREGGKVRERGVQ
jgi:hypothetical protein